MFLIQTAIWSSSMRKARKCRKADLSWLGFHLTGLGEAKPGAECRCSSPAFRSAQCALRARHSRGALQSRAHRSFLGGTMWFEFAWYKNRYHRVHVRHVDEGKSRILMPHSPQ